jgi:hypothetical protein
MNPPFSSIEIAVLSAILVPVGAIAGIALTLLAGDAYLALCERYGRYKQRRLRKALRIKNRDIDRAYSNKQFSVPFNQRDFK